MTVIEQTTKKKLSKAEFKEQLAALKPDLPNNYGVIIQHIYPHVKMRSLYNVVNYGVHDEEILDMLKFIVPSKN